MHFHRHGHAFIIIPKRQEVRHVTLADLSADLPAHRRTATKLSTIDSVTTRADRCTVRWHLKGDPACCITTPTPRRMREAETLREAGASAVGQTRVETTASLRSAYGGCLAVAPLSPRRAQIFRSLRHCTIWWSLGTLLARQGR
jgi:hypothetical protein